MKKLLTLLLLIAFCHQGNSQELVFNLSKKDFIASEIVMNDGTVITGFIKDFTLPNTIEFRGIGFDFKSIESKLSLDRSEFNYKSEEKGPVEKLKLTDIQSIVLKAEDTIKYEKIKLKTINSKLEVVDLEREIMAPLIEEGKINLYGFTVYECSGNCIMTFVIAYIKKPEDEFAYIPIDFNRINLFNFGNIDDKLFKAFEETGKDCPDFVAYLKETQASFENKENVKDARKKHKELKKERTAKVKEVKGARAKNKLRDELITQQFLEMYLDIIDVYEAKCE